MVGDIGDNAGDIQTLSVFNTLSSKGDQTVSVNVCIKVSDSHFMYISLGFIFSPQMSLKL
jgi:hypothetical protein